MAPQPLVHNQGREHHPHTQSVGDRVVLGEGDLAVSPGLARHTEPGQWPAGLGPSAGGAGLSLSPTSPRVVPTPSTASTPDTERLGQDVDRSGDTLKHRVSFASRGRSHLAGVRSQGPGP